MNELTPTTELHPAESAVGAHFDEEVEIAALAQRYYDEAGRPENQSLHFWLQAEQDVRARRAAQQAPAHRPEPASAPVPGEQEMEEAMHLRQ